jgi:hypothetical protein
LNCRQRKSTSLLADKQRAVACDLSLRGFSKREECSFFAREFNLWQDICRRNVLIKADLPRFSEAHGGRRDARQCAISLGGRTAATFQKPQQLRGLNQNHNHEMKHIFKSAATRASCGVGPFRDFYAALPCPYLAQVPPEFHEPGIPVRLLLLLPGEDLVDLRQNEQGTPLI